MCAQKNYPQKSNIIICESYPIFPQRTSFCILWSHGWSNTNAIFFERPVGVVHDAAAVIRGAICLTLTLLTFIKLGVRSRFDVGSIDSYVIVTV